MFVFVAELVTIIKHDVVSISFGVELSYVGRLVDVAREARCVVPNACGFTLLNAREGAELTNWCDEGAPSVVSSCH